MYGVYLGGHGRVPGRLLCMVAGYQGGYTGMPPRSRRRDSRVSLCLSGAGEETLGLGIIGTERRGSERELTPWT